MKKTFVAGDRVRLLPMEDNPEELGVVEEASGKDVYVVTVDDAYRVDETDDGLREVESWQLELVRGQARR